MRKLVVRCIDKTVFPINSITFEAESCGWYDPWCFSDPDPKYDYMSKTEWDAKQNERWRKYYE